MVRENDQLPPGEQLELRAFSLDEAARLTTLSNAEEQVAKDRCLREVRCQQQRSAAQTVLHECWHRMEVKPRCIKVQ